MGEPIDELYRTILSAYAERALLELLGRDIRLSWYHLAMLRELERCFDGNTRNLVINLPPGTLKTSLLAIFVTWLLLNDPTLSIALVGLDDEHATKFALLVRRLLESDWRRRLAPSSTIGGEKNTQSRFRTIAGGEVCAVSINGAITGDHYDVIVMDDLMKASSAAPRAERRALEEIFRTSFASRFKDPTKGVFIVAMQRLNSDDFTAFFLRSFPDAEHLCLPAICNETAEYEIGEGEYKSFRAGELLDRERLPQIELDKLRRLLGLANYNAQYLQEPLAVDLQIVDVACLGFVDRASPHELRVVTIDPAFTSNNGDHTGLIVANLIGSRTELIHGQLLQVDPPRLARLIKELDRQFEPDLILIEAIGGGGVLVPFLEESGIQRLLPIPSHGRQSKIQRMEAVKPTIDSGKVTLLRGAPFLPRFLDDIAAFPNGASDDYPDALSQLLYYRDKVVQAALWHRKRNPRLPPDPPEITPRYRSRYATQEGSTIVGL